VRCTACVGCQWLTCLGSCGLDAPSCLPRQRSPGAVALRTPPISSTTPCPYAPFRQTPKSARACFVIQNHKHIHYSAARWRPRLRAWLRGIAMAHSERHQLRRYNASYVRQNQRHRKLRANEHRNSTSLRSSELRTKSCLKSRNYRPGQ
jgi:hypothetical protein